MAKRRLAASLCRAASWAAVAPARALHAEVSYISPSGWPSGDGQVKRYYQTAVVMGDYLYSKALDVLAAAEAGASSSRPAGTGMPYSANSFFA